MANQFTTYQNTFGIDRTQIHTPRGWDCRNITTRPVARGGFEKRNGFQVKTLGVGGCGLVHYQYTNADAELVNEQLTIDTTIHRIKQGVLGISYSGAKPMGVVRVIVDDGQFKLVLIEDNATVLTRELGTGYDESTTELLSDTATSISAVAGFAATASTGTESIPSAFLDLVDYLYIPAGETRTIPIFYTEAVNSPVAQPLQGIANKLNTPELQNVSATTHRNLLFVADGEELQVYDGQTFYRAGLPIPTKPKATLTGGVLNGSYVYYQSFEFIDARGNKTESELSDPLELVLTNNNVELTLQTLAHNSGYNTNCALVNGNQALTPTAGAITLNVRLGKNTLKAGDTAYLYNHHADIDDYQTYTVSSVTATTITLVSTDPITAVDKDVISNNLKVNLYRATAIEQTLYLLDSKPNNSFVDSVSHTDSPAFARIDGHQTLTPSDEQITITVDSGSALTAGDWVKLQSSGFNDEIEVEVVSLSGTQLIVKYPTDLTLADKGLISYSENNFPSWLGDEEITQGPPPKCDLCLSYRGTLLLAKDQNLFWSDENNLPQNSGSQSFPPNGFTEVFPDKITGLSVSGANVIVHQKTRIDGLGPAPTSDSFSGQNVYSYYNLSTTVGTASHSAIVSYGSFTFFLDHSGVYIITGGQLVSQSVLPVELSSPIRDIFLNSPYELRRATAAADARNQKLYFFLPKERSDTPHYNQADSLTLVYDLRTTEWFFYSNFDLSGGAIVDQNNDFYFSQRTNGPSRRITINKLHTRRDGQGYNDHAAPILGFWESGWNSLEESFATYPKTPVGLEIYAVRQFPEDYKHDPALKVFLYKDYVDGLLHSSMQFNFPNYGQTWGFRWNDKPFGSWRSPSHMLKPKGEQFRAIKFRIENNEASTNMLISGLTLEHKLLRIA